jgi:tripartite-type tricarboxylate transporter receptor subunit TctC
MTLFHRRQFLHLAAGAAALPSVSRMAWAQAYPTRPVTFVVGAAAGGPNDVVARILAPRMSEVLGQQVIVENVVGAGGMTGYARVAKRSPTDTNFLSPGPGLYKPQCYIRAHSTMQ